MREDPIAAPLMKHAERAVTACLGERAVLVTRFAVGLSHHVYDVITNGGERVVVRIARPQRREDLQGGLYWHERLESAGVPLPRLLGAGEIDGHPFAVYQRLRGTDLEEIYPLLSGADRRSIAHGVAAIQRKVSALPQAHGFGHAHSYDDPCFARSSCWVDVLMEILDRTEREIADTAAFKTAYVDLVREEIAREKPCLSRVAPVAFLHDTNIRNVIVRDGQISGVIDVDEVSFGDPLLSVGLAKTYMLLAGEDIEFVQHWCEVLDCLADDAKMIDLYALMYAVRFMGTLGQKLNGNASRITDPTNSERLEVVAERLLAGLRASR